MPPSPTKKRPADGGDAAASSAKKGKTDIATEWIEGKDLIVYVPEVSDQQSLYRAKIAGFDIDGTIITTKSGKVFAKDENDWRILYPAIPGRLNKLYDTEDTRVVFFTNQAGLAKGKVKLPALKKKFEGILKLIKAPVTIFISPGSKNFRKPHRGMWEEFERKWNGGVKVDRAHSVYVGDAAGREAVGKVKKDFSCGDRLFAMNIGVTFRTPEEFFLDKKVDSVKFNLPKYSPKQHIADIESKKIGLLHDMGDGVQLIGKKPEIVVMSGAPASGKSHFAQNHLVAAGYEWVNRDTLKTWQKCVAAAETAIKAGKSVVVDNTNPDLESRSRYIKLAKDNKATCRCFVMRVDKDHAKHNNAFRLICGADKPHQDVNDMVMNMHFSKAVEPSKKEGFDAIVGVNFIPEFEDASERDIYCQFLLEK